MLSTIEPLKKFVCSNSGLCDWIGDNDNKEKDNKRTQKKHYVKILMGETVWSSENIRYWLTHENNIYHKRCNGSQSYQLLYKDFLRIDTTFTTKEPKKKKAYYLYAHKESGVVTKFMWDENYKNLDGWQMNEQDREKYIMIPNTKVML